MKIKSVWLIFFLAIISLLIFQSIWLYNTYHIKKEELYAYLNKMLIQSVEEEMFLRIERHSANQEITFDPGIDIEEGYKQKITLDNNEVLEAGIFQQLLELVGHPFEINLVDSLFKNKIEELNVPIRHLLVYSDSTGNKINQSGNLDLQKRKSAFITDSLLIIEGKRIHAIVNLSPMVIFKRMIWMLIASFIMLLVISYCLIYQTKTIFTQYKLNRLREDFTNALTHDMKTPLSTIHTVIKQLQNGSLDDKPEMKAKFSYIAIEQVSGLQALVDKILTIAKAEQHKMALEVSSVDLQKTVQELVNKFSVSSKKEVHFQTNFDLKNTEIQADPTLLQNAISNLIDNAIKYSDSSVNILIDSYVRNEQLFIRVVDNGYGISEKDQQKIFDKFERGTAVYRKEARGFGLGLNYVKGVVEAHNGIVSLHSTEGEGSEFVILIPLIPGGLKK